MKDKDGMTVLHYAIGENNLNLVKFLVAIKGIDVLANPNKTPFHLAAEKGYLDIVKYLLALKRFTVNIKTSDGVKYIYFNDTALHLAAEKNHPDVIHFLVSCGDIELNHKNLV